MYAAHCVLLVCVCAFVVPAQCAFIRSSDLLADKELCFSDRFSHQSYIVISNAFYELEMHANFEYHFMT